MLLEKEPFTTVFSKDLNCRLKKKTQPLFGKGLNFASLKCNFQLKLKYLRMGHEARPTVFICLVFTGKKRRQRVRKTREVKKYSNGHERPVYR